MHMREQAERRFNVRLDWLDGYCFASQASEDGTAHGTPYISDEPDPVGMASGPSTPALLASAISHCLSAALLEALRKARVDITAMSAEAEAVVRPNAEGLPRIDHVAVTLKPTLCQAEILAKRCAEIFESYCTVTSSVKRGIDVRVKVDWNLEAEAMTGSAASAANHMGDHR